MRALDARELLGERGVGDDASRLDLAVVSYRDVYADFDAFDRSVVAVHLTAAHLAADDDRHVISPSEDADVGAAVGVRVGAADSIAVAAHNSRSVSRLAVPAAVLRYTSGVAVGASVGAARLRSAASSDSIVDGARGSEAKSSSQAASISTFAKAPSMSPVASTLRPVRAPPRRPAVAYR